MGVYMEGGIHHGGAHWPGGKCIGTWGEGAVGCIQNSIYACMHREYHY